ncbi:MAG TPA: putative cobaltochelatase [Trebonia sp.]|jgi:magnesium chelatase subunit D|nr:putative cobaltochelatase [Trebonia sp.]
MTAGGFPFSAVVGMDDLRLALVLNAVSPAIGGVLVRGEKGTAKSTMVRALAAVLPEADVVAGCRFSCDPAAPDAGCPDGPHGPDAPALTRPSRLVELPVGATEDRLVGALDIERALTEGVKAYEPGLLAAAHRGVLYVDEVNLLHDHLVDLLLDAAALGTCYVEREGVSVRHPARFLLVGTMNPEEGELRPQLLDRFGLAVEAAAPREAGPRAEVIRRRLAYDSDPAAFRAAWAGEEARLARRIAAARRRLPGVLLPDAALRQVAAVCAAFGVDGLRADLVTARAAMAHAAWEGRPEVSAADIRVAARLALPHRRRRQPFDAPGLPEDELDRALAEAAGDDGPDDDGPGGGGKSRGKSREGMSPNGSGVTGSGPGDPGRRGGRDAGDGGPDLPAAAPGPVFRVRRLDLPGTGTGAPGRRSRSRAGIGRIAGARPPRGRLTRLHLPATIAAAAPHQLARGRGAPPAPLRLRRGDLRQARVEGREGNLVLFVVDASGSMAARSRMGAVKGAILSLLVDAYQRRDKVGMVTFRGSEAQVLLPPTSSVEAAVARLAALPAGGRTPLAAGLLRADEVLRSERLRDPHRRPLLVVVTDGRATGGPEPVVSAHRAAALLAAGGVASVVVDCETGPVRTGLAAALAASLGGVVLRPAELAAGPLADSVRAIRRAA